MVDREESSRTVCVTSRDGLVTIIAGSSDAISVQGGTLSDGGIGAARVEVTGKHRPIVVRCPPGTNVVVGTSSGRVELRGDLGDARVTTQSGRISIESATRIDARTRSGRVSINHCSGSARVQCASGRIEVGDIGELDVTTQSGRIVGRDIVQGRASAVSGRVELGAAEGFSALEVTTVSGAVDISVPPPARPSTALETTSGRIVCDLPPGDAGHVGVRTTSGRIRVRRR